MNNKHTSISVESYSLSDLNLLYGTLNEKTALSSSQAELKNLLYQELQQLKPSQYGRVEISQELQELIAIETEKQRIMLSDLPLKKATFISFYAIVFLTSISIAFSPRGSNNNWELPTLLLLASVGLIYLAIWYIKKYRLLQPKEITSHYLTGFYSLILLIIAVCLAYYYFF